MREKLILMAVLCLVGCGKDSPKAPAAAKLLFPEQNSECTTGVSLNETTSSVEFLWQKAANADSYELRVTHGLTNVTQTVSTAGLSAELPLEKGVPFSWIVISRNNETQETASSNAWQFYNAGSQRSYAPFPAVIILPRPGTSVFRDINNEIVLEWEGADIDDDIVGYELYFSTENPPATLFSEPSASTTSSKVSVEANTVYYWKLITIDSEDNRSDSGSFGFKVL
jgi:hypothetical protein